jgi:integrase/recombinase XerD
MSAAKPRAPAGCFWRGDTLWGRTRIKGRLVRWSLNTDNPAVAKERRKAGKDLAIAERVHGDAPRSYEDALERWGRTASDALGANTLKRYLVSLKQIDEYVTGRRLAEINRSLIGEIVDGRRKQGVTTATIRRDLAALSSVMNHASLHGWIDTNPALPWLKNLKERRDPILLPRRQDIELVISRAPGNWPYLIRTAWATGAREDELIRAKRRNVDHERRELTVIGKGNKLRTIDLKPMNGYKIVCAVPEFEGKEWLFWRTEDKRVRGDSKRPPSFRGDRLEDPGPTFVRITEAVAAYAEENGIDFQPFRFHDLRHRHAVDWLQSGLSIYDLQQRLGHSTIKTTEGYLKYVTADQARVATHTARPALKIVAS